MIIYAMGSIFIEGIQKYQRELLFIMFNIFDKLTLLKCWHWNSFNWKYGHFKKVRILKFRLNCVSYTHPYTVKLLGGKFIAYTAHYH